MKRAVTVLLIILFSCTIFTGCGTPSKGRQGRSLTVYSFSGENEYFSISNGVIVLSSAEEIFYGGDLEVNQEDFGDIMAYSITAYITSDDGKDILLSNSVTDMTGGTINISGDVGRRSGVGTIIRQPTDELQNNLYFELETTNIDGGKNNYQVQVTLTEVTEKIDK